MTTALLVVDMQNAFCRREGSFARRGLAISNVEAVVASCRRLVDHAKRHDWPVVLTRLAFASDYHDAGLLAADRPEIRALGAYVEGSFDAAIVDELMPAGGETLVVRKTRYDPFAGTALELQLRERGVDQLVVCGVTTNVCVESSVRRAYDLDFRVRIVEDAMSSYDARLHAASLETMARHFASRTSLSALVGAEAGSR